MEGAHPVFGLAQHAVAVEKDRIEPRGLKMGGNRGRCHGMGRGYDPAMVEARRRQRGARGWSRVARNAACMACTTASGFSSGMPWSLSTHICSAPG